MKELTATPVLSALTSTIASSALGAVLGGSLVGALVIGFTELLKATLAVVHLPLTAIFMVLGRGGPRLAMLTCLATVMVAGCADMLVARLVGPSYIEKRLSNSKPDSYLLDRCPERICECRFRTTTLPASM